MKISLMDEKKLSALSPEEKLDFVYHGLSDDNETGDVALVLGCPPKEAILRTKKAAELYKNGRVQYVLVSGGVEWEYGGETLTEADLMKKVLLENGVPEEVILCDREARTTLENMVCSTLIISRTLKISKVNSVLLVTSAFHMQRSFALAKALLPRKIHVSRVPVFPNVSRGEWLSSEGNRKLLNSSVRLLKRLIDNGVVEDLDISE